MTQQQRPTGGLSPNARIGLVVGGFGVIVLILVLLSGGSGIPTEGPVLNFAATDVQRTVVAEQALSPRPPERWIPYIRGRRKPAHDLLFVGDSLYVAAGDGLFLLDPESGDFLPVPGFPEDVVVLRVWQQDGQLRAGLEDGHLLTVLEADGWADPLPISVEFPPANPVIENVPAALADVCGDLRGVLQASDGAYWLACESSVVRVAEDSTTRYLAGGLDGLPGEPTGALAEGLDGRLWVGLDNGVTALEPAE